MTKSSTILKSAVEVAQLGLAELDTDGRFVEANSAYLKMLGVKEADLLGKHWSVTAQPEDHQRMREAYELARTRGGGYVEIRGLRADASVIHQALTVESILNDQGDFVGYHCLRHDISAQKQERETLMLAIESAPSGLLLTNSAGQIEFANRAVEILFGHSREELMGRPVESLMPERFRERHVQFRQEFINSKGITAMAGRDLWGLRNDGVEIPLQLFVNRIESNNCESILVTIVDIAERVRYENELRLARQTAEFASRAKSDFLARMSHEIRTPMSLILGMNTLLLESPVNDKQRQQIEISYKNTRRLLRLINGILDLSKVEAGMLTLEARPFELNEVLEQCAATMSSAITAKGLEFQILTDLATGRYWIGDAERLQQVLLNLIGNSLKFTAQGRIEVKAGPEVGAKGERGLRFEVVDTGCGVPLDKTELIFEAFQQAKGSTDRPYEGTGLGLSISKTLIQMMGGKIWVDKGSGPGTKIVFTVFPQPTSEEVIRGEIAVTTSPKAERTVAAGTRLLLVDDSDENAILVRDYLDTLPISLDLAVNGVDGLAKRKKGSYDLILMDVEMPIMDGYTATREIRAWEKENGERRIPIVAVTAHAHSGAADRCKEVGCDGYLSKPVERGELIDTILTFSQAQAAQD